MILLDTHIWIWWILGEDKLSQNEIDKLDELAESGEISISAISIWETEILERKSKIRLEPDFHSWIQKSTRPSVCKVLPIHTDVILAQRKLPDFFHVDPADRLITATAMKMDYPLATKDQKIIESGVCEIWSI